MKDLAKQTYVDNRQVRQTHIDKVYAKHDHVHYHSSNRKGFFSWPGNDSFIVNLGSIMVWGGLLVWGLKSCIM